MGIQFKNNASSQLASSFAAGATSFSVTTGHGVRFPPLNPGDFFYVTLEDGAGNIEIVKVTTLIGDTFGGIVRAQDGTAERSWTAGDVIVECRLNAAILAGFPHLDASGAWSGAQTFNGDVSLPAVIKAEPKTDNSLSLGSAIKRWLNIFISGVIRWGSGTNTVSLGAQAATGARTILLPDKTGVVALIDSPAFTGTPTAPTPVTTDVSTKVATTEFVATTALGAWTTGDVKVTFKSVPDSGWIMVNDGSIGDALSGASNRANADCLALFTLLWASCSDALAPVSTGRGASAAADWAAHKTITLPKMMGRSIAIAGSGAGLTARALGDRVGEENHALSAAEMPFHGHGVNDPTHAHGVNDPGHVHPTDFTSGSSLFLQPSGQVKAGGTTGGALTGISIQGAATGISIQGAGGNAPHNNMQPTTFLNAMVKL